MNIPKEGKNRYFAYRMFDNKRDAVDYQLIKGGHICSGLEGSPTKEVFDGILNTFGIKADNEIFYFNYPFMVFHSMVEDKNNDDD